MQKNKTVKFISFLLIISIIIPTVLFSKPQKTEAAWWSTLATDVSSAISAGFDAITSGSTVTDTAISIKNVAIEVGKQVLMNVAKRALQEMTKSTINWINSGFHGSPLFLENPQSFFEDIAKSEVKNLVDMIGYDTFRFPFGKQTALGVIDSYKRQFETNAQYSLSKVINDPVLLNQYRNDFNVGGWNAFLINTQYPQNNYLGFQMIVQENLASKVAGTVMGPAEKVKDLLAQGQGFLSPETCADNGGNNEYNKVIANAWNRPSFDEKAFRDANAGDADNEPNPNYLADLETARTEFNKKNFCKNLVNTTPGAVVADQIKINLGSGVRQTELAGAMGNSISAIVNALLNKFIGDGLNSLASSVNPPPENTDTWSYDGQTLGSPTEGGTRSIWDGPDQEIILGDFKKAVDDGINNTNTELQLMSNESSTNPGITQLLSQIWPKARELDICLPGPDVGWEDRLEKEKQRNGKKLQEKANDSDGTKSAEADLVLKELSFAIDFFEDWIINKMMTELPNSIIYMDAVDEVHTLSQESDELTDASRLKRQALARLQAIKNGLATITAQPVPGSSQEKILISLKKQYDATRLTVSNITTVDDRQNELNVAKEKYNNLRNLVTRCETERKAKSWGIPGGRISSFSGSATPTSSSKIDGIATNSEQALFCNLPVVGGYNHESFINKTGITHPETPLVNGQDVLKYKERASGIGGLFGQTSTRSVNIKMSCNIIFNATLLDYKGNLPGSTTVIETYVPLPDDTTDNEDGGDDGGTALPADIGTKHGNHADEVEEAKQDLIDGGKVFSQSSSACDSFEITKETARLIGGGGNNAAGLLSFPEGSNCQGYAIDVIAFPDGYIYNILDSSVSDGHGPVWNPASCGTSDGTCPDRYRGAI